MRSDLSVKMRIWKKYGLELNVLSQGVKINGVKIFLSPLGIGNAII
jgi:hypothetical protein